MAHKAEYEVAIIGGGFAGLGLACLLGKAGVKTVCIDEAKGPPPAHSLRTTVITYGSKKILEEAGIWKRVAEKACPIKRIEVLEGDSPVLLDFDAAEAGGKIFGWVVLNSDLRAAMAAEVKSLKSIRHIAPARAEDFEITEKHARIFLESGAVVESKLVIGADGRNSYLREWMNVRTREWDYRQRAIVCAVTHTRPHKNTAIEHFMEEGPFAILPMADDAKGNHRSAVIITEHGDRRKSLMRLSDEKFEDALAAKFPARYGEIKLTGGRAAHDLSFVHAASYIAPRMALVADAAHGIHPVAGQGLNLGFCDVKALADLVIAAHEAGEDVGDEKLLQHYEDARRFDNTAFAAAMDMMARGFSNAFPPLKALRRVGLKTLARFPKIKRFIMRRAMGD